MKTLKYQSTHDITHKAQSEDSKRKKMTITGWLAVISEEIKKCNILIFLVSYLKYEITHFN